MTEERREMDERFESVMGKVRKILAKAERTDVAAEAEAFMAKAQELMARWQIDEALLAESEGRQPARVASVTVPMPGPHASRRAGLFFGIAATNGCEAIQVPDRSAPSGVASVVVGDERDVDWVATLFSSLNAQLDGSLSRARPTRPRHESPKAWSVAFVAGFIGVMHRRLNEAAEAAKADHPSDAPSVALVLAAKQDEVHSAFKEQFPRIRTVRHSTGTSGSGRRAGQAAGERATIAAGAAASAPTRVGLPGRG